MDFKLFKQMIYLHTNHFTVKDTPLIFKCSQILNDMKLAHLNWPEYETDLVSFVQDSLSGSVSTLPSWNNQLKYIFHNEVN